jgi:CRISPR-associated protein Csx10
MLRLEERARPGILEADAEVILPAGGELPPPAELLLRAGAAAIDGLGGKRNRGAGRCWLLLPEVSSPGGEAPVPAASRPADPRLAELSADTALLDGPGRPPGVARPAAALQVPRRRHKQDMPYDADPAASFVGGRVTRRVLLEVVTPLVAQYRVLGNVVLTRDFVPGSMLLPEILGRLSDRVGHREPVVGDARPALVSGDGAVPGLPAPMIWSRSKDQHRHDVVNAAHRRPNPADRRKSMRSGHVAASGEETWCLVAPEMAVSTHAVIDDDNGRPGRGGVFTYLGIAPGTLLVSDIVLPADADLRLAVGDLLRIGRSRKDDFGQARVRDIRTVPGPDTTALDADAAVRVWCVSDVLLRGAFGAFDPSAQALADELVRRLGVPVDVMPQQPGGPMTRAHRAARRDSFHSRWGRPRPTLVGLAAGSVTTVRIGGLVAADALALLQREGIGERTAEGFGQIRFGAAEVMAPEPVLVPAPAVASRPDVNMNRGELPPAPAVIERAAVQAEIGRRVAAAVTAGADRIVPGARSVSSRAQWGSLRQQLPRLRSPGGREAVARWFDQTLKVRQRRAVWGEPALTALRRLVTEEVAVWEVLSLDETALEPFVLAPDRSGAVRAALWDHAVSVLITEISRDATRVLQAESAAEGTGS